LIEIFDISFSHQLLYILNFLNRKLTLWLPAVDVGWLVDEVLANDVEVLLMFNTLDVDKVDVAVVVGELTFKFSVLLSNGVLLCFVVGSIENSFVLEVIVVDCGTLFTSLSMLSTFASIISRPARIKSKKLCSVVDDVGSALKGGKVVVTIAVVDDDELSCVVSASFA
jgi:hypothetical protein